MIELQPWMVLVVAAVLYGFLFWVRSGAKGGVVGRRIRDSDWQAWRMAMDDAERKLRELRAAEPRRFTSTDIPNAQEKR